MNTDAIFQKYWKTLLDLGIASEVDSAIALALRLAIQEAADANAALVNDMSAIIANLRAQTPDEQRQIEQSAKIADLRYALNDANEDAASARRELITLIAERDALRQQLATANNIASTRGDQLAIERREVNTLIEDLASCRGELDKFIAEVSSLRQQLAQLDADNADLTKKLAAFNGITTVPAAPVIHPNGGGNGYGTLPAPFNWKQPISTELADYWESLDAGRRSFRQLDKRIRLDLVQTALASFEQLPTQAAFNAAKPEWMPTATSICTAFACKWEDLPALKWEQVKL